MQQRAKYRRHSQKHKGALGASPSPREQTPDKTRPKQRPANSSSPAPNLRKIRSHGRSQNAHRNWVADWENQSSSASPYESPTGLLHVRTRSGWTSQTWQSSHSEELDPATNELQKVPQRETLREDFEDVMPELLYARMELQQLCEENGMKRNQLIAQLQDLMSQRDKLNKELNPDEDLAESTAEITESGTSQTWITMEMDRLANELEFKAQVAELLRTTLLKTKSHRTNLKSAMELKTVLLDAVPETTASDVGKTVSENKHQHCSRGLSASKEAKEMEKEVASLEGHLKLLNDALDDEKQENYELAQGNSTLKKEKPEASRAA